MKIKKSTQKTLTVAVLSAVGVVGGAYALQVTRPDWAEKIGASWLLEKLRLIPPAGGIKVGPAEAAEADPRKAPETAPVGNPRTVAGRQYGTENSGKASGRVGAGAGADLMYPTVIRTRPVFVQA